MTVSTPGAYDHPIPPSPSPLSKVGAMRLNTEVPRGWVSERAAGQWQCPGWMESLNQGYFTSQRSLSSKI